MHIIAIIYTINFKWLPGKFPEKTVSLPPGLNNEDCKFNLS
jgi:hypothetical protein